MPVVCGYILTYNATGASAKSGIGSQLRTLIVVSVLVTLYIGQFAKRIYSSRSYRGKKRSNFCGNKMPETKISYVLLNRVNQPSLLGHGTIKEPISHVRVREDMPYLSVRIKPMMTISSFW